MSTKGKEVMDWIVLMTGMEKVPEKMNLYCGVAVAVISSVLGQDWQLFAGFLALNLGDYFTGWAKSRFLNKENSKTGAEGAMKKVFYWVVIGLSFFMACGLKRVGEILGTDLGFMVMIGYVTLGAYIINEARSILENLHEMNVHVPSFLIKGLEVANKKVNAVADFETEEEEHENK